MCFLLFPARHDEVSAPAAYPRATPLDAGIPFEDLHMPVNGSEQIHAWWVIAFFSPHSNKVLLVFHGNGYVLEQSVTLIPLHDLGPYLHF